MRLKTKQNYSTLALSLLLIVICLVTLSTPVLAIDHEPQNAPQPNCTDLTSTSERKLEKKRIEPGDVILATSLLGVGLGSTYLSSMAPEEFRIHAIVLNQILLFVALNVTRSFSEPITSNLRQSSFRLRSYINEKVNSTIYNIKNKESRLSKLTQHQFDTEENNTSTSNLSKAPSRDYNVHKLPVVDDLDILWENTQETYGFNPQMSRNLRQAMLMSMQLNIYMAHSACMNGQLDFAAESIALMAFQMRSYLREIKTDDLVLSNVFRSLLTNQISKEQAEQIYSLAWQKIAFHDPFIRDHKEVQAYYKDLLNSWFETNYPPG